MSDRRTEFPEKTLLRRWQHCGGRCEYPECGAKLFAGKCQADHDIACELGGDNSFENCRWLCLAHHKLKTKERDMPAISKVRRLEKKHLGIRKPSTFPKRADPWNRRFQQR